MLLPRLRLLALSLVIAACQAPAAAGSPCTRQSDCPVSLTCRFGHCRSECTVNRDCGSTQSCIVGSDHLGACQLDVDLGCETGVGRTCQAGLVCANDRCINPCATNTDCPTDGACRFSPPLALRVCVDPGRSAGPRPDGGVPSAGCDYVTDVCVGDAFACAIRDGEVICWGDDSVSQRGDLRIGSEYPPSHVLGPDMRPLGGIVAIECGSTHACALDTTGDVLCWGNDGNHQLASSAGSTLDRATFVEVDVGSDAFTSMPELDADVLMLGGTHSIAHRATADGWVTWGDNAQAELGDVSIAFDITVVSAATAFDGAVALGIGTAHSCAATSGGVTCRGITAEAALGDASIASLAGVTQLALGVHHSCALSQSGVSCWGADALGQLGDGPDVPPDACTFGACSAAPRPVTLPNVARLVQGSTADTTCAITQDGELHCWGENGRGQVDATLSNAPSPVRQVGLPGFVCDAALSARTVCALVASDRGGTIYCWGENGSGQLGILPDGESHALPLEVRLP